MADGNPHAAPPRIETVRFLADEGVARPLAADIVARVSRHLLVPCRLDTSTWDIRPVRLGGRDQVDADGLLASLASCGPGVIQVGLTRLDIGLPIFTFVFGRAMRGGQAAIVSLARLTPEHYGLAADADVLLRRAATEILHELGHVVGLGHCNDFNCIMHFAPKVESIDVRGADFCAACAASLPPDVFSPVHG